LIGGTVTYLGLTSALVNSVEARRPKPKRSETKPNGLVLLGDLSEFENLNQNNPLMIMSPICTHLGCNANIPTDKSDLQPNSNFYCPCHGGEYDQYGFNIAGPPPRPLDVYNPIVQGGKVYFHNFSPIKRELT
jgi:Rieske Fe-S protein